MTEQESMDTRALIELVSREFPDLRSELEGDAGLECQQAMTLEMRTQGAMDQGDMNTVRRCLALADRLLQHGDPAVQAAMQVSFLETLDFRARHGSEAFAELTPGLLAGWRGVNEYLGKLLEGEQVCKGPAGRMGS